MALKNSIIDLAIATKGDSYFQEFDKLVPENYVIKRHPGQYWAGSNSTLVPDLITKTHRIAYDEQRLAAWSITAQGLNWNAKQLGLQLMNPLMETVISSPFNIPPNRIYNPASLFLNLASPLTMLRFPRHGLNPFDTFTYEGVMNQKIANDSLITDATKKTNRLIQLGNEFGRFDSNTKGQATVKSPLATSNILPKLFGTGEPIKTLSGLAGPGSVLGIGRTRFFKASEQSWNKSINDINVPDFKANRYNDENKYNSLELPNLQSTSEYLASEEPKYNPGDTKDLYDNNYTPSTNTLDFILSRANAKYYNSSKDYINAYSDITRIQNQETQYKTFEKRLDSKNTNNKIQERVTQLEDVHVYEKYRQELKTKPYNDVFNMPKRLSMSDTNATGKPLTIGEVDNLMSEEQYRHPEASGDLPYNKVKILAANGGIPLFTKKYNIGIATDANDEAPSIEDLVKFRFNFARGNGTAGFLQFRGYLTNMTDSFNPEWEAQRYVGRPDSVQKYDGFNRTFNFSFMVVAMSKNEKDIMWAKLSNLVNKVSPVVSAQGYMSSPFVYLTIGSYILDEPGYLDNLTYTISDDYPWDISDERPMYINVSTSFKFLGKESPSSTKDYFPMRYFAKYE